MPRSPETLDPALCELNPDLQILHELFEGLVTIGPTGEALPGQAESWTVSEDGLTYRFTLRTGLEWSNGAPVTAEDFAWSWRRTVDPKTGSKYAFPYYPILNAEEIVNGKAAPATLGVRAIDERTLEVRLKAPTGFFLKLTGLPQFSPAYRPAVEQYGRQYGRPGNLVGNGRLHAGRMDATIARRGGQEPALLGRGLGQARRGRLSADREPERGTEALSRRRVGRDL